MSQLSPLIDSAKIRSWLVCEAQQRWLDASRRFALDLIPSHLTANVVPCQAAGVRAALRGQTQSVVLWEITSSNAPSMFDLVLKTSLSHPGILQIAATSELRGQHLIELSELGIGAVVAQPEHLPALAKLVQRYFYR